VSAFGWVTARPDVAGTAVTAITQALASDSLHAEHSDVRELGLGSWEFLFHPSHN
jgi:hypothetical protein